MISKLPLRAALGTYRHTEPIKAGRVGSPYFDLDFVEIASINRAFRPMVNELAFDVSEMALVTYMLARAFGVAIVALPIVTLRISPFAALVTSNRSGIRTPKDLPGKTIGVRAYTQTTGVWVRGILHDEFGVNLSSLRWLTTEGAHVSGYVDPTNVKRTTREPNLTALLLSDEIHAAVGIEANSPDLRTVIPEPARAEKAWKQRTGIEPINHVVVVKRELTNSHPWLQQELLALFRSARPPASQARLEPDERSVEVLARYAVEQGIIPQPFAFEELFPDAL